MAYEWSREKARVNLRSHGVPFEEAATVFLDPLAMTYADPDHSADEEREITIAHSSGSDSSSCRIVSEEDDAGSSARGKQPGGSGDSMKKAIAKSRDDELRPEYDLSQLKGGVRSKHHQSAVAGTNVVVIEPELSRIFPDTESVNRALRLLVEAAEAAAGSSGKAKGRAKKANVADA